MFIYIFLPLVSLAILAELLQQASTSSSESLTIIFLVTVSILCLLPAAYDLLYTRKEPTLKYSNLLEILKYFVITTKIVLSIIFFYYCVKCAVENQFGLAGMLFMLLCISFPHFNKTFALRHAEYSATASLLHSHSSQYPDSTTILQVSSLTTPEASRIEYLHPPITYEEEKNISFYYSGEYGLKHKVKIEVLYADYEEIEGLNKDNNIDTYEVKRIVSKIYDFDTKELSPVNDWIEKYNLMRC